MSRLSSFPLHERLSRTGKLDRVSDLPTEFHCNIGGGFLGRPLSVMQDYPSRRLLTYVGARQGDCQIHSRQCLREEWEREYLRDTV